MLMPLSVNSITRATGYKFKNENQAIYLNKDLCEFTPRRQWPEITLPVPTEAPPLPTPPGPNTQLIRAMQMMHDTAADILRSQGTDPCAIYREGQVEHILNHVEGGHTKCKVCNKELSTTQKLKSHIWLSIVIVLPTNIPSVPNHLVTLTPYLCIEGSMWMQQGSMLPVVGMPTYPSPS